MTSRIRPPDELANVLTHGVGLLLSLVAAAYVMGCTANQANGVRIGCGVYSVALILVYGSSTLSHLFYDVAWREKFRTLDQACIFLLIAGTYTPFAMVYMNRGEWRGLLLVMWLIALIGVSRVLWLGDLPRIDKVLYGILGLLPVIALPDLSRLAPQPLIIWLIAGGACYLLGTVFLRFSAVILYAHAVWHVMVMLGSACHYRAILLAVAHG